MDECSKESEEGLSKDILSCIRVSHLLISPIGEEEIIINNKTIKGYCYGKEVGLLFSKKLTDNWFCVEKIEKTEYGLPYEGFPPGGI